MPVRHEPPPHHRDLIRLRRHLRLVLDAARRRHVADLRFYQLLSDADRARAGEKKREIVTAD